ncbi:MAG: peroxidase family protein, partial [Aeromicrobium sp.]
MASIRGIITGTNAKVWRTVNKTGLPWYKLPEPAAALNLAALREDLRDDNLYGTEDEVLETREETPNLPPYRTYDGTNTDPHNPKMGSAGTRFGRNFALDKTGAEDGERLLTPNPREVSRTLFWRDEFVPATSLNVLAGAWIQFQNHGWFGHGENSKETLDIELPEGDDWTDDPMVAQRTT